MHHGPKNLFIPKSLCCLWNMVKKWTRALLNPPPPHLWRSPFSPVRMRPHVMLWWASSPASWPRTLSSDSQATTNKAEKTQQKSILSSPDFPNCQCRNFRMLRARNRTFFIAKSWTASAWATVNLPVIIKINSQMPVSDLSLPIKIWYTQKWKRP